VRARARREIHHAEVGRFYFLSSVHPQCDIARPSRGGEDDVAKEWSRNARVGIRQRLWIDAPRTENVEFRSEVLDDSEKGPEQADRNGSGRHLVCQSYTTELARSGAALVTGTPAG